MSQEPYDAAAPQYGAPIPETPADELSEPRQMSPISRLVNVFFSPGEVFEDVRRSPRDWWLPVLVLLAVVTASGYVLQYRLNLTPEVVATAAIDSGLEQQGKTRKDLSEAERNAVQQQEAFMRTMFKFGPVVGLVYFVIFFAVAAGVYYVMLLVAQAKTTFFRVLSVVAYAYFVPNVLKSILQGIFAFLKSPDDVDAAAFVQSGGLLTASPAAFFSVKESPVLWTLLSYFDVFSIWFLVLLAIGFAAICAKRLKLGTAGLIAAAPYVLVMLVAVGFAALRS